MSKDYKKLPYFVFLVTRKKLNNISNEKKYDSKLAWRIQEKIWEKTVHEKNYTSKYDKTIDRQITIAFCIFDIFMNILLRDEYVQWHY